MFKILRARSSRFFMTGITAMNMLLAIGFPALSNEVNRYIFQGNGWVKEGQNVFYCQHLIIHNIGSFKLTCDDYQLSLGRPRQSQSGKLYYRNASITKRNRARNRGNLVTVSSSDIGCSIKIQSNAENNVLEKFRCAGIYGSNIFEAEFNASKSIQY